MSGVEDQPAYLEACSIAPVRKTTLKLNWSILTDPGSRKQTPAAANETLLNSKMFKKPPALKPASPLRSSARRAFIAHLQSLYPALAAATPEQILSVVPNGIKQCGAATSGGQKAVMYTDETGKPLWFEVGHDAGSALQQSQQQHKKQAHSTTSAQGSSSSAAASGKGRRGQDLAEVIPTIYTLWLLPNLLPRLPTWPQIVDPPLLSGSALMIPGLIPSPHTFPAELQWRPSPMAPNSDGSRTDHEGGPSNGDSQRSLSLPVKGDLIAVTAHPSTAPMVVARLEADMTDIVSRRAASEKGKAATTLHTFGDSVWELGGKEAVPSDDVIAARSDSAVRDGAATEEAAHSGNTIVGQIEQLAINDQTDTKAANAEIRDRKQNGDGPDQGEHLDSDQVDTILYLTLLNVLVTIEKQAATLLPMPISALYSTHVLPNRPAHWPPRDAKGKRRARIKPTLLGMASDTSEGEELVVGHEAADIRHSSFKKLAKWIKAMEKGGLLKTKEIKGKDVVVTSVNDKHEDVKGLSAYLTISQMQPQQAEKDVSSTIANSVATNGPASQSTTSNLVIVIERFWRASSSSAKLFQEMGCTTSEPLSKPEIRHHVLQYVSAKQLVDPRNQALIRIDDPHLTHALFPKVPLKEIPPALPRNDIVDRLISTTCVEYHRSSRLRPDKAETMVKVNTKGPVKESSDPSMSVAIAAEGDEVIGQMSKGAAKSVTIEIRTRQGRKVVSLITNLDVYGIDAEAFAADLMRIVGASASASTLPSSTPKHPKFEIFIQGDQRKAICELLESQHGLDRRYVHVHDLTKK